MKIKFYLIITLLFFVACNETMDEPIPASASLMVGKWKLTEAFVSTGGPQYWIDVENGQELEFFANETFYSDRFTECMDGIFSIEANKLLLEYTCDGFNSEAENNDGFITYNLEFFSNYFMLTPTSGFLCTEGCSYKYIKQE